jgi:hypothetical protein
MLFVSVDHQIQHLGLSELGVFNCIVNQSQYGNHTADYECYCKGGASNSPDIGINCKEPEIPFTLFEIVFWNYCFEDIAEVIVRKSQIIKKSGKMKLVVFENVSDKSHSLNKE